MLKPIALTYNRKLLAAYSRAPGASSDWIVYVPESGSDFQLASREELNRLIGARLAARFNFLAINKPGMTAKTTDPVSFERSFRRLRRLHDARATIRQIIPSGHNIYLIGYSEGAYLAPQIARGLGRRRVRGVAMIGGGTRGWLNEEISNARLREKRSLLRQVREIEGHSRSIRKWNGFSYATWYSYRADSTLEALQGLDIPTLAILGARDRVINLRAAVSDLKRLGTVKTKLFRDCGHEFKGHWTRVRRELEAFIGDISSLHPRSETSVRRPDVSLRGDSL